MAFIGWLTFELISISANSLFNKESFGLFYKIEKTTGLTPTVKNLTLKPNEVYANNVSIVGTLAGIVKDANIININVDAKGVIVQGKNIVGGVVGLVEGNSKVILITSNISVNANNVNANDEGSYLYNSNSYEDNLKIAYAGSIAGVVNVNLTNDNNERIRNIKVLTGAKVLGKVTGFAFGLISEDSGVDNVSVVVDSDSYINSTYTAGLIVGENRGYITRAETKYENENETNFNTFINKVKFIGGIAGLNNNGTIVNSISKVNVISLNDKTLSGGGIAGVSIGGRISSVYVKNNIIPYKST